MATDMFIAGIFILDLWAVTVILHSSVSPGAKTLWCLLVLFFPVIGFMLRFMFGPEEDPSINEVGS